jgi:hypothetical protein
MYVVKEFRTLFDLTLTTNSFILCHFAIPWDRLFA